MKTILRLIAILLFLITQNCFGGTFISNVPSGNFHLPATWSFSGDADGIPDSDDDITILNGHIISLAAYSNSCRNLTINAGGTFNSTNLAFVLEVNGDYSNLGTESGTGTLLFKKPNGIISGTGAFGGGIAWNFFESTSISSNATVIKNAKCRIRWGRTVTNNGSFRLNTVGQMVGDSPTSTWINAAGSNLIVNSPYFMVTGIRNFSSPTNTLTLSYNSGGLNMFSTVGNLLGNLTVTSGVHNALTTYTIQGNLSISGATSNLRIGSNDLILAGNFTNTTTGTYTQTITNDLILNGTTQTIAANTLNLGGLVINNGTTINHTTGTVNINDHLTLDGTLNVAGAATMVLVSNASQTAVIEESTGSVTGNLTLQRFISGREAGYSDMSAPTNDATFVQIDDDILTSFVYNPPSAYPSIWMYNESIWDYVPITDVNTSMFQGVGYEVFLDSYGDTITWDPTTIEFVGNPTIGDLDIAGNISFDNDGWNLVGNPYHANLDWDALFNTTTDVSTDIMFYDESINDFITVSTGSGELIAPAQGFWINITSGSPTFTFTEAIKSTSKSSSYRTKGQELFAVRLKNIGTTKFTSGTSYRFTNDASTAAKGDLPFKKLAHPLAPALYSLNNSKGLRIKLLNSSTERLEIPLGMSCGVEGIYTIEPEYLNQALAEGFNCIQLVDKEKNTIANLMEQPYQFYSEKGEFNSRFILVLSKSNNCDKPAVSAVNASVDINRIDNHAVIGFKFDEEKQVNISITNTLGQEIVPSQTATCMYEQKYIGLPADFHGIFIVNVWVDGQIISKKLFK